MARYEISNEVKPLDRLITGFASSCGYEIQTVFNDLLRFIIHGFSPGAPPISNWKYKRQQNASFMEMTAEWTRIMQKQIGRSGWFDAFGELHMAYCSKPGQQANGQFFTPSHICELMVMCAAGKKETGQRMGDPTCGSGRLLLAYHAHNPGNYLVGMVGVTSIMAYVAFLMKYPSFISTRHVPTRITVFSGSCLNSSTMV